MKMTTKELNVYYARVLLESFDEDYYFDYLTESQKFEKCYQTFLAECGWCIQREGNRAAFREWLKGLPTACSVPFTNWDIVQHAIKTGHLSRSASKRTERQEQEILDNYWKFITCKFYFLLGRNQEWFDKNLNT
jgi:hypothetical protein